MAILGHPVQLGLQYRHDLSANSRFWPSVLLAHSHESCFTVSTMVSTTSALEDESC